MFGSSVGTCIDGVNDVDDINDIRAISTIDNAVVNVPGAVVVTLCKFRIRNSINATRL
jgi:hypothetical protein